MTNQKISVFFDTNSYSQIVRNKNSVELSNFFNLVKSAEKGKNIEPISTLTVNLELSSNLVEGKRGINYENCLNGLRFLTNHCFDVDSQRIRISSLPFFQISGMLFGALPIDFDRSSIKISRRFELFKSFNSEPVIPNGFYEFVKTTLSENEEGFSNSLIALIDAANHGMRQIYPNTNNKFRKRKLIEYFKSDAYAQNLALNSVKIVAEKLNVNLDNEELQKRAIFLRKQLPISSAFFQWILCEIIEKNIDMTSKKSKAKRWNWLWDYQISFIISESTINEGKIILITSDKEIIKLLKDNGLNDKVMTIDQYLKFLGI